VTDGHPDRQTESTTKNNTRRLGAEINKLVWAQHTSRLCANIQAYGYNKLLTRLMVYTFIH